MKLSLIVPKFYRVKAGQTLASVAAAFSLTPALLARENGLTKEVWAGQILSLPAGGNRYVVQGGESRTLLSGSAENFKKKNGTGALYVGQAVIL